MTTLQIVAAFGARKYGKDSWRAKCPNHKSRSRTLGIKRCNAATMVKCFAGCTTKEVMASVGLEPKDLFEGRHLTVEVLGRLRDSERLEKLGARCTSILFLAGWDKANASYWEAALRRIHEEMERLYCKLMPDQYKFEKVRRFEVEDYRNKRLDWLREKHERDAILERGGSPDGGNGARSSLAPDTSPLRGDGVHAT